MLTQKPINPLAPIALMDERLQDIKTPVPSGVANVQPVPVTASKDEHFGGWPNDLGFHHYPQDNAPTELKVTGAFPGWTAGTLLRIGPGANKVDRARREGGVFHVSHWFDGFTTCHKFTIEPRGDGTSKVIYMSRGQVDRQIETARQTGNLSAISFAQKRDPCDSLYKKMKTFFEPSKKKHPEHEALGVTFAPAYHSKEKSVISGTSDRHMLKEFSIESLEPVSVTTQSELHPALKGQLSAAHPCQDPQTGDLFNYNLDMGAGATYRIFRTKATDGSTDVLATIGGSDIRGSYIHSLFLTEHFVILCVWPAFFAARGIPILWERNLLDAIEPFNKSAKCTWYVIDRVGAGGVVKKFTSPAMFCFHSVNAWEEERIDGFVDLMAELCEFETTDILHRFYYENLMSSGQGAFKPAAASRDLSLARYRLSGVPLAATSGPSSKRQIVGVAEKVLSIEQPRAGDLPTINQAYYTKRHRYVYAVINRGLSSFVDAIGKTDTETGECKLWSCDKHTPGEPIFIANPEAQSEDDGVLLVVVLDGIKGTSYLLCLDARNLQEIARAECEVPVSFGFHGIHLKA